MISFIRIIFITIVMSPIMALATGQTIKSVEEYKPAVRKSVRPVAGFVPDKVTATRIAEAILIPIYGQETVASERPFVVQLTKGVWKVKGYIPPDSNGGVAEVWIDKQDGRILFVSHGK